MNNRRARMFRRNLVLGLFIVRRFGRFGSSGEIFFNHPFAPFSLIAALSGVKILTLERTVPDRKKIL